MQRFHDIKTIINESEKTYDFYQNLTEDNSGKSLLFKFREADDKWKQVNRVAGAPSQAHTGNAYRAPSLEDKASKRQKRNEFLDATFITNWGEV